MARLSTLLIPTERQPPADAQAISHQLMVRAGMVRQIGTGLWSWLPLGFRAHQNIVTIIRQELNRIGAQELLLPLLQPRDLWRKTGRDSVDVMFTLQDRKTAELVLAMTHEEAIAFHASQYIKSYRDLPQILYQFQLKGRDEPRPRAGVLRTREFIMKDSYSLDRDQDGLKQSYQKHIEAYDRIFERSGLEWYRVESDVGMMGGLGAHEYMAPCAAGEDEIALAPGYAANVEVACAQAQPVELPQDQGKPCRVDTPGVRTIAALAKLLKLPEGALLKAFPIVTEKQGIVLVTVRGDHRINDIKLQNALGEPFRQATPEEIEAKIGPPGSVGPVDVTVPVLLDSAIDLDGVYVVGANLPDVHLTSVRPSRDFHFKQADVRRVEAGDLADGHPITLQPAIEVGNIFQLGTRYSEALGATYLDEQGKAKPIWMGSYGIGPARIVAAAVEQFADERGIVWPKSLAPYQVQLVVLGKKESPQFALAEQAYQQLSAENVDVLFDDREVGAGEKFADAELIGAPVRLTIGKRAATSKEAEVQARFQLQELSPVAVNDTFAMTVQQLLEDLSPPQRVAVEPN